MAVSHTQYHFKNGYYFERLPQGNVKITTPGGDSIEASANEWASIVAAMSADGETARTYNDALDRQLHKTKEE